MLATNDEVLERLNNPENILRRRENDKNIRQNIRTRFPEAEDDSCAIKPLHNGGRRPGDKNISQDVRAIIGADAQVLTLEEVAEAHQVSIHHAHELANGKNSTAQGVNPELVKDINNKLSEPHSLAVEKLTNTLLAIDNEKLKHMKPKELAGMASQLSRVMENTAPLKHDEDEDKEGVKLIVYSPTIKQENHYQTVEVERSIPNDK